MFFRSIIIFRALLCIVNAEGSNEVFSNLPTSSFIESYVSDYEKFFKAKSQKIVFHVNQRINKHVTCNDLEFLNIPTKIEAPLMGSKVFKKLDKLYNQRAAWFNGVEYLSFATVGTHGTWIIGKIPGQDNGFVFLRPEHTSFTPIGLESSVHWKWNLNGEWTDMDQIKVVCKDHNENAESNPYFYEVNSFYASSDFSVQEETSSMILTPITNGRSAGSPTKVQAYFSDQTTKTFFLHSIRIICSEGIPVKLHKPPAATAMARLVNHEIGASHSWRMSFRYLHADPVTPIKDNETNLTNTADVMITLDSKSGEFRDSWKVQTLNEAENSNYNSQLSDIIENVKIGDYIWIWSTAVIKVNESAKDALSTRSDFEKATEVLLLCLSTHHTADMKSFIFRHFPHDRRDQMGQTSLARDIGLVKITVPQNKVCTSGDNCKSNTEGVVSMIMATTLRDHRQYVQHVLHGAVCIGPNPVPMMRQYVAEKERVSLHYVCSFIVSLFNSSCCKICWHYSLALHTCACVCICARDWTGRDGI